MKTILLDTSVIIDFLRIKNKTKTLLYALTQSNYNLSISMITYCELYSGERIWKFKKELEELESLLLNITILPLHKEIGHKAGEIRAKYGTELLDAIIAATAIESDIELATFNIKDFQPIKGLKLFKK